MSEKSVLENAQLTMAIPLKRHSRHIRRSNHNVCSNVKFSKHVEIKQALN